MKLMMWGLPIISLTFTWWFSAGVQLSFFAAGLASFAQTSLLKSPEMRKFFGITPMPVEPTGPRTYPGSANTPAGPLSTAEIGGRYEGGAKPAVKDTIKTAINDVKGGVKYLAGATKEKQAENEAKKSKLQAEEYEKRRTLEIKEERLKKAAEKFKKKTALGKRKSATTRKN